MIQNPLINTGSCNEAIFNEYKDVGSFAIFSASSTREGFGLENVRDDNRITYWQSNGGLPHYIDVIFPKYTKVSSVYMFISPTDESYSPFQVLIQIGTDFHDLKTISIRETSLYYFWQGFDLTPNKDCLEILFLRLVILSNHFNGIDSRIHQLLICAPKNSNSAMKYTVEDYTFLSEFTNTNTKPIR